MLIVDDETLMRSGIRLMIDRMSGIEVVGEAKNGALGVEQAQQLDPDVILMDLRMPTLNGIEAITRLRERGNRARVVVLTAFDTDDMLLGAFRAGALSFLLKDAKPELVISTIVDAASGEGRVAPQLLERLVQLAGSHQVGSTQTGAISTGSGQAPFDGGAGLLTERELEVGRCVATGMTNAEICEELYVSLATVKTHLGNLFAKLHVTNRVQLALRIIEINQ